MIKPRKLIIPLLISTMVALSGCGTTGNSTNPIQSPDDFNVKQEELKKTLDKLLPGDIEYLTPEKSEQKQGIFIDDINQDGKQEAFVLYKGAAENQQVQIFVLQEENGKWNKVHNVSANKGTFDYFMLQDLDGDGNKEIIASIAAESEPKKQLVIYEWDQKGLTERVNRTYEEIDIADYNADGRLDILALEGERNKSQTVQRFSYEKGELKALDLVELDPSAYHENIISGKLADGKKALFIDSGLGAHSMLTEIVAYNNGKLVKMGDDKDNFLLKAYPLYSRDINRDGIIEAGGMYIPKGWENAAFADIPFIHVYADYNIDGTRQIIEERYTNDEKNFYITIPSALYGKVTIKKLEDGVNIISNIDQKVLFEIKWMAKASFTDDKTKLIETADTVFYTDIQEKTIIPVENFHLLEDEAL